MNDIKGSISFISTVICLVAFVCVFLGGFIEDPLAAIGAFAVFLLLTIITRGHVGSIVIIGIIGYLIVGFIYSCITGEVL